MTREEFIVRVRHIGWVGYQMGAGQAFNERLNKDQFKSLINGVTFALEHPAISAEENHDNWMRMKLNQGWKYGLVKDFEKKEHPDMVPYGELPEIERKKDDLDLITHKAALEIWDQLMVEMEKFKAERGAHANRI